MTESELVFMQRMASHVQRGKSFDEAAQAVVDDDKRLLSAILSEPASIHGGGDHGWDKTWDSKPSARALRRAFTEHIYNQLRAR